MCVIIVPTEKHPTLDELEAAEVTNPHGGAIAWKHDDGLLRYIKDIDAADISDIINCENPQFPYIIHFRITSSGTTRPELCHPFPINHSVTMKTKWKGKSSLLFHNGTCSDWETMIAAHAGARDFPKGHIWSDSRALAWLAYKTRKKVFQFVHEKIAILNLDGTVEYFGRFDHEDSFIMSNTNHIKKYVTSYHDRGAGYLHWQNKKVDEKKTKVGAQLDLTPEDQTRKDLSEEEALWTDYLSSM